MNTQTNIKTINDDGIFLSQPTSKEVIKSKIYFAIGVVFLIFGAAVLGGIFYYGIKYM